MRCLFRHHGGSEFALKFLAGLSLFGLRLKTDQLRANTALLELRNTGVLFFDKLSQACGLTCTLRCLKLFALGLGRVFATALECSRNLRLLLFVEQVAVKLFLELVDLGLRLAQD